MHDGRRPVPERQRRLLLVSEWHEQWEVDSKVAVDAQCLMRRRTPRRLFEDVETCIAARAADDPVLIYAHEHGVKGGIGG